ncbi:MAG: carbon starvation protein A [Candidatus Omnitrophota bacterium]
MSSQIIVILSVVIFAAAYRFYGSFVARRVFRCDVLRKVPAKELRDDIDYVPTNKEVLFGHHFASIAGTGPIVGPAIAVIWGWVPALVWIILGSIFAGAVHDYAAITISTRGKGRSIGELSKDIISPRVRTLFLFIILFTLWIVVAIFGMVMAVIFDMYPQSVIAVWAQIPLAMTAGYLAHRKGWNITAMSVAAVVLMYAAIAAGIVMPLRMPGVFGISPMGMWIIVLLVYAYIASVLPVWALLQPRDYINSHQLVLGIGILFAGIFFSRPAMVAPAVQFAPEGAPPILPFLFITVACGAISGFHALVGSGTTSKQVKSEEDIKFIGFGGMLTEGFLSVLVIVAVSAGIGIYVKTDGGEVFTGLAAWNHHYSSWGAAQGLTAKITAFVNGSANMIGALGIPTQYAQAMIGVLVASFAGTTLDTATRIQRYVVTELASGAKIKPLEERYTATAAVVGAAALLAFSSGGGGGALLLWPLFGISNQLLAGLALLVATVYLIKRKQGNVWVTAAPMIFMIVSSSWAMAVSIPVFFTEASYSRLVIGVFLLVLEIWMILEALYCLKRERI